MEYGKQGKRRMFGGQLYRAAIYHNSKTMAKDVAAVKRRRGLLARVVKTGKSRWSVFVR